MRILYFADIRFPIERANGIQTMETCHALATRGHTVDLVVRRDTHTPARDPFAYYGLAPAKTLRIEHAPVPAGGIAQRAGFIAFAAGRAAGQTRADVIYTRDLGIASTLLSMPGRMRAPLVYESHGYAPDVAAALPELLATATTPSPAKLRRLARREAFVWSHADGYVTITQALADELTRRLGPRARLAVAHDGVRPSQAVTAPPASSAEVVGYAGHLYAWKGVDVLLQALARVPEAAGLIIGGHEQEPDLARCRALAASLGIADRVTFTGYVDPPRVPALLQRATILVLPNPESAISTHYTSPLKLFEYMAAARAIVASDLPAIREVVRAGETAVLVPPGDPQAIADAIRALRADPERAQRLARAARERVADFSWARRAERIEQVLDAVRRP
jgi:glycosyltransferase involved in cell wall biosynthesis